MSELYVNALMITARNQTEKGKEHHMDRVDAAFSQGRITAEERNACRVEINEIYGEEGHNEA